MNDTYVDELEAKIARYLMITVPPVFIIVGTVGNLLSILVMSRKKMRSSNAAVYLITLAIADTGALYYGLLPRYIKIVTKRRRHVSETICKVTVWLTIGTKNVAVWILVAFTIERFMSICFPYKVKTFCTHKSSVITVIGIVVVIFAYNGHFLYGFGNVIETYENTTVQYNCTLISNEYADFLFYIYPWIDLCVNCFVPVIIIIVCNFCIAVRVLLRGKNMQQVTIDKYAKNCSRESLAVTGRQESHSRLTIMLFTVTIVFLISTTPFRLFYALLPWLYELIHAQHRYGFLDLIYAVSYILMYLNNSINFILYCVTGSKFRNEVRKIFKKLRNIILEKLQNPTNVTEKVGSRRPSMIARQTLTEVTELRYEASQPLQIPDNQ